MPVGVRVVLEPVFAEPVDGFASVVGVVLGLTTEGAPGGLSEGLTSPASLRFSLCYLEQIRKRQATPTEMICELFGTLSLEAVSIEGERPVARFAISPDSPLVETQPEGTHVRHSLQFALAPESVAPGGLEAPLRLRLFAKADQVRLLHAELSVELVVGGEVVASTELNDTLDVPLNPRRALTLNLVDPNVDGPPEPLPNTGVVIRQSNGFLLETKTNDKGQVFVRGHDVTLPVQVEIPGQACLVIQGGVTSDTGAVPVTSPSEEVEALDGCGVDLGDTDPTDVAVVVSPDEDTAFA